MADLKSYIPFLRDDNFNGGYDINMLLKIGETVIEGNTYDVLFNKENPKDSDYLLVPQDYDEETDEIYAFSTEDILKQNDLNSFKWASPGVEFNFVKNIIAEDGIFSQSDKGKQTVFSAIAIFIMGLVSLFVVVQLGLGLALGLLLLSIGAGILYYYKKWERDNHQKISTRAPHYLGFMTEYLNRYYRYAYVCLAAGGILFVFSTVMFILAAAS